MSDTTDTKDMTDKNLETFENVWNVAIEAGMDDSPDTGAIPANAMDAFISGISDIPRRTVKKGAEEAFAAHLVSDPAHVTGAAQLRARVDALGPRPSTSAARDPREAHAERVAVLRVAVEVAEKDAEAAELDIADKVDELLTSDASDNLVKRLERVMKAIPVGKKNTGPSGTRRSISDHVREALGSTEADELTYSAISNIPTQDYPDGEASGGAVQNALSDTNVLEGTGWSVSDFTGGNSVKGNPAVKSVKRDS